MDVLKICSENNWAGDEELAIDILANNVIFQNLRNCGSVVTASSAETLTEGEKGEVCHF